MHLDILSDLVISKVCSVSTMYTYENTAIRRNNRELWGIVIKYEGETIYKTNDKSYISNMNNLVILPKGCSYNWCCIKSGHFSIIEFECEKTSDEILSFSVNNGEKLLKLFKELEYKRAVKKPMYEAECIRDTYSVILELMKSVHKKYFPSGKLEKIEPAMNYIAKNYNRSVKNEELAKLTGLSTVYFRKLFTEVVGTSPIEYVHNLRINKAKEMLKSDYGRITDIAYSLGYSNIYDFSRTFKKHTGVSPSKYI